MIDQATLLTYLAVLTGFVFIPGPAVLLTLARAASSGTRVGIATGLGIAVGDLGHTAMAVFGLSAILAASALLFNIIKYAGAAYLVYLGLMAILARADGASNGAVPAVDHPRRPVCRDGRGQQHDLCRGRRRHRWISAPQSGGCPVARQDCGRRLLRAGHPPCAARAVGGN